MDIIKAFETNNMQTHITIKGTHEEPLFRASDIGAILDISKIRNTIQDFDDTEKVALVIGTLGGPQEVTFLTEKGLYHILFTSRKPIAKLFKNWVCEVIKEIRLKNLYEYQEKLVHYDEQLKLKDAQIIDIIAQREQNILKNFSKKPILYVGYTEEERIKFGVSDDFETRIKKHKSQIRPDWTPVYIYESLYNREIERRIKQHKGIDIINKVYNSKKQVEIIQLSNTFTIKDLDKLILQIKKEVEAEEYAKDRDAEINSLKLANSELVSKIDEKVEEKLLEKTETVKRVVVSKIKSFSITTDVYNELYPDKSTENFIVVKNIITEKEHLFSCITRASIFTNLCVKVLNRYKDSNKLIHGNHIRTYGNAYWKPLKEYRYSETTVPFNNGVSVKSVNLTTGEINIYESTTDAARFLKKDDSFRAKIGKHIKSGSPIITENSQTRWSIIPNNLCGEFVKTPGIFDKINGEDIKHVFKEQKALEKCKIIARNLKTGEDIYCKTLFETNKLIGNSVIKNYLDIEQQIKGYIFRTPNAEKYWIPPDNFKYLDNVISMQKFYVKATNKDTGEITYYDSAFTMAIFFGLCNLTDTPKIRDNVRDLVKRITKGEVKTSAHEILNKHTYQELKICGYYVYKDGRKVECEE